MALLRLGWVPSPAADSCARKKDFFESAVAAGIAALQSLEDDSYRSHKGQ